MASRQKVLTSVASSPSFGRRHSDAVSYVLSVSSTSARVVSMEFSAQSVYFLKLSGVTFLMNSCATVTSSDRTYAERHTRTEWSAALIKVQLMKLLRI